MQRKSDEPGESQGEEDQTNQFEALARNIVRLFDQTGHQTIIDATISPNSLDQ